MNFIYSNINLGTFPIDTTKTRLQVQGQISDIACREVRYRGMIHAFIRIYKEEGLLALYNGSVDPIYMLVIICDIVYPHLCYVKQHTVLLKLDFIITLRII